MNIPLLSKSILATALAAASLAAQMAEPSLAAAPHTMPWPDHALTDVAADGTLWAGHESWKASFAADGATFHPFLGAEAPATHATFALRAVRCAGHEVPLGATTPVLHGQRVDFDRGAAIESYELRREGIEQRFVFDALPARGVLQLDVGVTSDLTVAADANGHTLLGELGGLRYGSATAIDARGQSCDVPVQFADGAFHLTVPADFVAAAALPLVVDPLIGTTAAVYASAKELSATDIAFDQSLGQFFVTFERAYNATDHDVYVVCTDLTMNPQTTVTVDFTTEYWSLPRIAALEAHDTACVVAQVSTGNVSPFAVKARTVTGGPSPLTGAVLSLTNSLGDCMAPDIGGDANPVGSDHFLVAYEDQDSANMSYQYWILLDAAGNESAPQHLGTGISLQRGVTISKTCGLIGGGTEGWALVHRQEHYQQTTGQLCGWFVQRNGALRHPVGIYQLVYLTGLTANAGSEWDVSSPTVDSAGRHFLCVETRVQGSGSASIYGTGFDWMGNIVVPSTVLLSTSVDRRAPRVDSDGVRYVLASENVWSATDHDVRVTTIADVGGTLVLQDSATVSVATDADLAPAVTAMSGQFGNYGLAWVNSNGTTWNVQARRYQGIAPGGMVPRGTGCSALTIFAVGLARLGDTFSIVLGNVTGIPAIIAGAPTSVPLGICPGCILGVDGQIFVGPSLSVPVPLQPSLVGVTVSFQGLQLNPSLGGCLGQFQLADTIDATVQ